MSSTGRVCTMVPNYDTIRRFVWNDYDTKHDFLNTSYRHEISIAKLAVSKVRVFRRVYID